MEYKSQYGQDKFLNERIFKNKKNGIYVDIGAHNGISLSNTYFFEKNLGWNGICFEPNPKVFSNLQKNRTSINIEGCAWYKDEVKKFRVIDGYSQMLSGILETYDLRHLDRIEKECELKNGTYIDLDIQCYDINLLLERYNFLNIDLLSIDTEGSEFQILSHIDFHRFKIDVLVVENNYRDKQIPDFLNGVGYKLYDTIRIDEIYVKQ